MNNNGGIAALIMVVVLMLCCCLCCFCCWGLSIFSTVPYTSNNGFDFQGTPIPNGEETYIEVDKVLDSEYTSEGLIITLEITNVSDRMIIAGDYLSLQTEDVNDLAPFTNFDLSYSEDLNSVFVSPGDTITGKISFDLNSSAKPDTVILKVKNSIGKAVQKLEVK